LQAGDPLFVITAMKMENTILSTITGIVLEISVQKG